MPCESYKNALTEAAATAAEPQSELRAHLEACDPCRAAFAAEQSLFSSIDMGLQAKANAEIPATLLPGVRVRLNGETLPSRSWVNARLVLAGAATLAFVFLMTQVHWRPNTVQKPVNTVANNVPSPSAISKPLNQNPAPVLTPTEHPVAHPQVAITKRVVPREFLTIRNLDPEVLVPRDQEILLASYQQDWQSRKRAPLLTESPDVATLTPLELAPIQIAQLDVKLMAEEHAN